MTKIIAAVLGTLSVAALCACADSSAMMAKRMSLEETVSIDEAVVEIDVSDGLALETGLEGYSGLDAGPESETVDIDLASDSG